MYAYNFNCYSLFPMMLRHVKDDPAEVAAPTETPEKAEQAGE